MEAWHSPPTGTKITGPGYDRIVIHQSPSATGKFIVDKLRAGSTQPDNQIHSWKSQSEPARTRAKQQALAKTNSQGKGFFNVDVLRIHMLLSYLQTSDLRLNRYSFLTWNVKDFSSFLSKLAAD